MKTTARIIFKHNNAHYRIRHNGSTLDLPAVNIPLLDNATYWDQKNQKCQSQGKIVLPSNLRSKVDNDYLSGKARLVEAAIADFTRENLEFALTGKRPTGSDFWAKYDAYVRHHEKHKSRSNGESQRSAFRLIKKLAPDTTISDINFEWMANIQTGIAATPARGKKRAQNGVRCYMNNLKGFISKLAENHPEVLSAKEFSVTRKVGTHQVRMSDEQKAAFAGVKCETKALALSQDWFMLLNHLGFRFGEMKHAELVDGHIRTFSPKTGKVTGSRWVHPVAQEILDRHNGIPALPVYSTFLSHIKKIGKIAGISESDTMGTHTARRTLVRSLLDKGAPPMKVQKIGNWASIAELHTYAGYTDADVNDMMQEYF